jgi:hypothetical protein
MAMQYDVTSAHINGDGFAIVGRTRLKGFIVSGQASAGTVDFFDTLTTPVTATYGSVGTLITVTSSAHGLVTGDYVGIAFQAAGGVSGTDGNYRVTYVDANTFTVTSLNTVSVATNTACTYAAGSDAHRSPWVTAVDTSAVTAGGQTMFVTLPGEGILIHYGLYLDTFNINSVTVFFG